MVWGEDPLTGDGPHRQVLDESDEQQAQELAPQYGAQPEVQWAPGTGPVSGATTVFLLGQPACLLAEAFFPQSQPAGSISVAELVRVRSPMEEEYGSARQPVHTCSLRVAPAASGPLLLVCGARELPPEQAAAWAQGVLAALRPSAVALACTLPALSYRGPGDPADKDMVFSLQTSAAAAAAKTAASGSAAQLPLPLPDATMLGGLPAALLAACELRGLPAAAAAGVQAQQVPDAQFLFALGQGAQATLRSALGGPQQAQQEAGGRAQLVAALGAAADAVYRSSASSSIFS